LENKLRELVEQQSVIIFGLGAQIIFAKRIFILWLKDSGCGREMTNEQIRHRKRWQFFG
jgi:hypothetical protein